MVDKPAVTHHEPDCAAADLERDELGGARPGLVGTARLCGDQPGRTHRRLPRLLHPRRCRRERLRPSLAVPEFSGSAVELRPRERTRRASTPRCVVGRHHTRPVEDHRPDPGVCQLLRRQSAQRGIDAGPFSASPPRIATPMPTADPNEQPSTTRRRENTNARSSTGTSAKSTHRNCLGSGWRYGIVAITSSR